ncbi:YEATS domain-containing protein 2-like [Mytilus californianus]|uniref:YEATS domain-containing protein 2-like n=1 Tax=Mytilus californianus TaxID=6549 RepID=UPI002247DE14|nr:YEATS domain-containing protein 2-like [Mytilus californianus]
MAVKRGHIDLDPDYEDVTEQQSKRQRVFEEDAKEATRRKIENIIHGQFTMEIQNKEEEVDEADQKLNQSRMVMDRLRACIIANFYSKAGQQKFSQIKQNPNEPPYIHPTVKEHIGKAPKNYMSLETSNKGDNLPSVDLSIVKKEPDEASVGNPCLSKCETVGNIESEKMKIDQDDGRSSRFKTKKRIVMGNVSKYIPVDRREENDQSTHKWMVYVRGSKEEPRIDHYVKKVWFFLHPSYRPNDLVEVSQPPFHLTRRGWGEFPVRVQLHFKDQRNKRVDIIHQLKLDRTYTGLQTLGSETLVDIELEKEKNDEKLTTVSLPVTFDLKNQLKSDKQLVHENNVTIPEKQSPKKKVTVTPSVNGIHISGDTNGIGVVQTLITNPTCSTVSDKIKNSGNSLTNSVSNTKNGSPVQLVLGGVGSVTNPNFPDARGDNKNKTPAKGVILCSEKGDKSPSSVNKKESNSAVILQGIGSLSTKLAPSQNQMRIISGNLPHSHLIAQTCLSKTGIVNASLTSKTAIVQPILNAVNRSGQQSESLVKTSKGNLILGQQIIGNNTLIVQPSIQANKLNTMIVKPTVQKTQSNMLLIQTVPQATRPLTVPSATKSNAVVVQQPLQATKPNTLFVNPTLLVSQAKTSIVQPSVKSGAVTLQVSSIVQPATQASKCVGASQQSQLMNILKPSSASLVQSAQQTAKPPNVSSASPTSPATSQTLYYRCKDAQGNIFLVPQQLLKQVIQSPAKSNTQSGPLLSSGSTTSTVSSVKGSVSSAVIFSTNSTAGSKQQTPADKGLVNQNLPVILGSANKKSPIILSLNQTGQVVSSQSTSANQTKSILKSTVPLGQDANSLLKPASVISEKNVKTTSVSINSVVSANVGQQQLTSTSLVTTIISNPSPSKLKNVGNIKANITSVSTILTLPQASVTSMKSGNSLLLTMSSANGKTVVMPTQSLNSNTSGTKVGTSLLFPGSQKQIGLSKICQSNTQNTNSNSLGNKGNLNVGSVGKVNILEPTIKSSNSKPSSVTITTSACSKAVMNVSSSMSENQCQGQISSQNHLQVTSQGLKIIVNPSQKANGVGITNPKPEMFTINQETVLANKNLSSSTSESKINMNTVENFNTKRNSVSILPKEFQIPVISSSHPSSLLTSTNVVKKTVADYLSTSAPSLTLMTSSVKGESPSLLSGKKNSITGTVGDKKIVVDLLSETERRLEACRPEKRIICLRKKSDQRRPSTPPLIVEEIKPIRTEDFPDVLSLIRAAVRRHPIVSLTADKYQHPYCASTSAEWLSWKVGKRRASEWQRAAFCRKFILNHIKGETYKGTKLWTTKQIMLWCRLHAFSPHYQESTLHPFGVELTADRIGKKFSSVTCPVEIVSSDLKDGSTIEINEEEDVDIINMEQFIPKKKVVEEETRDLSKNDIVIPPSDSALYIQDTCQRIGVKFEPTELEPGVCGNASEDMVFAVMKSFLGDIITETFAGKVTNGRYPDSLGMTDVFQALRNMSQTDFLTNCHLGVKVTEGSNLHR